MQDQIIDLQRRLAAAEARIAELERRERVMHPPGPAVVGPVLPFPKYEWSTLEPPLKPPYTVTC